MRTIKQPSAHLLTSSLHGTVVVTWLCAFLDHFPPPTADSEKVIELAPDIMDGYYHKGFALFNLKQYSEAVSASMRSLGFEVPIMHGR